MALREAWFGSSTPGESSEASLSPAQEAFLEDLAALLDYLDAARLLRVDVGAVLLRDGLHVVLPLDGAPRASVRLLVREGGSARDGILGTWHDKGEVWTQVLDADAEWRVTASSGGGPPVTRGDPGGRTVRRPTPFVLGRVHSGVLRTGDASLCGGGVR